MPWRYQPVYTEDADGERVYSLCELYFDDAGNFTKWTANDAVPPGGDDFESLTADLTRMLVDAYSWVPVRFDAIQVGFVFQKRVSQEDRNNLADYIEEVKDTFKRQPPPTPN